ncbi:B12-binding domain-containing radical SAM protein [uncultured Methanobacterium sp.]|uniref:B12-binding domain-containing radical SAM protein n=1 Tax=uncultured Methanobacterium sp. TaxID=176306 RepID=UPI002AA82E5F|nr:radical SAM protein [uncultured Methanobacterium sp.]
MDVMLINPYDENAVKNGLGFITPPLNLMYLASSLENASFSVKIVDDDLLQMGYEKISQLAAKLNPQIIAITATTSTIKTALKYVKLIKKLLPNSLYVIGGPHPTFMPREVLNESVLDVVVLGEGEETLVDLTRKYIDKNSRDFGDIRGIAYQDLYQRNIKFTQPRPLIEDLDSLPLPARHLIPFESYGISKDQSGGMITSRGCVFACGYCSSSLIMGKKFRSRSPENVVDEIEELLNKYKIRDIAFMDDTFMLNKRRANDIAQEIEDRNLDVSFVASSRVDMVDYNLLKKLKRSGMSTLYYGVESGSQRILNLMKKGITLKQAEDAVCSAKDAGLNVLTSFILGYPGETADDINKTINFSIKLNPDYSQFSILTPFPGTPIYHELNKNGLISTSNWEEYTVLEPILEYEKMGLTKGMVKRKLIEAYLKFYARPSYLLKHRHMIKTIFEIIMRSFLLPKVHGSTAKGWYHDLNESK